MKFMTNTDFLNCKSSVNRIAVNMTMQSMCIYSIRLFNSCIITLFRGAMGRYFDRESQYSLCVWVRVPLILAFICMYLIILRYHIYSIYLSFYLLIVYLLFLIHIYISTHF